VPSTNISEWNVSTLTKFIREFFEKDPPLNLSNLTVEELRVIEKLTVDKRSVFGAVRLTTVGRPGAPAFQNSWVNFDSGYAQAGYWKDPTGVVYLKGRIKSGTLNTTAFNLPPGFRPPGGSEQFAVVSNGALGVLEVQSDGDVIPVSGSNVSFSLFAQFQAA
jgi:hypothetical protein